MSILFILKERSNYGSYGLINSCRFIVNALSEYGINSNIVQVVDANSIDREVTNFKPKIVILEAIWVTPKKMEELVILHPKIKWVIRIHSMVPFLVSEGMSFEWLNGYYELQRRGFNVLISCNNKKLQKDLNDIYHNTISLTPNIYFPLFSDSKDFKIKKHNDIIDIGCFGALRILKNHSQQAIWAIELANIKNKILHFHINVSEFETAQSGSIIKNLRNIFVNTNHKLIEYPWLNHNDFLSLIKHMDLMMQVSFTETYNIIVCDSIFSKVPVIVSSEINLTDSFFVVNPSDREKIIEKMGTCLEKDKIHTYILSNIHILNKHNREALREWIKFLNIFPFKSADDFSIHFPFTNCN